MIRKQTWILLVVFAALLGVMFYLQQNPLPDTAQATPSVTAQPVMLPGWQPEDITQISIQHGQAEALMLAKDAEGSWMLEPGALPVEAGKVEQLRAQITDLRVIAALQPGFDPAATGLSQPVLTLTVWNTQGQETVLKIGGQTPIETGYYIQVGESAPVVVSKFAVEALLDLAQIEKLANITPTPEAPSEQTVTPQAGTPASVTPEVFTPTP